MPNLVGSPLQSGYLRDEHTQSGAPCQARIKRTIAAHNRMHWEHLRGQAITGQAPCAPKNPCGQLGHNHSGAGFGKPMRHTWWWFTGKCDENVDGGSSFRLQQSAASPTGTGTLYTTFPVDVPACFPGGCYETARVDVGIRVLTAATVANTKAVVTLGVAPEYGGPIEITSNSPSLSFDATTTGYKSNYHEELHVYPGQTNGLRIEFKLDTLDTCTALLVAISLSQAS